MAREEAKAGIQPDALDAFIPPAARPGRGPDDDAAGGGGPRGHAPALPAPGRMGERHGLRRSPWARPRTSPSRWRKAPRSCGSARGSTGGKMQGKPHFTRTRSTRNGTSATPGTAPRLLRPRRGPLRGRGLRRAPRRPRPRRATAEAELEDRYLDRPNVRRLSTRRRRDEIDDIFADTPPERRPHALRAGWVRPATAAATPSACIS